LRIAVVTVSDRASRGEYEDRSGPEIERVLAEAVPGAEVSREIVSDDEAEVRAALDRAAAAGADWILSSGGTGPSPRDRVPEATRAWIDRELPGIAEALRAASLSETPFAVFSRGIAGMKGRAFVVNLPGSPAAARFGASFLAPLLEHGAAMAKGGGH
jgi:molybdenum cofactor synthesis domain-containing protein